MQQLVYVMDPSLTIQLCALGSHVEYEQAATRPMKQRRLCEWG